MSILRIDTLFDGTPFYNERVQLDGEDHTISFKWNIRRNVWTFDLHRSSDDTFIIQGQTIKTRVNLLRRKADTPPGMLVCLAKDGTVESPTLLELGDTHQLLYFDESEALA